MRKSAALMLLLILGCQTSEDSQATKTLIEVTDQNFQREVLESELPVLVEFWAPWCRPCLEMIPDMERLTQDFAERAKVVRIRIDENPVTAANHDVDAPPTIVLFHKGKIVKRRFGKQNHASLALLLESFLDQIKQNADVRPTVDDSKAQSVIESSAPRLGVNRSIVLISSNCDWNFYDIQNSIKSYSIEFIRIRLIGTISSHEAMYL